MTEQDLVARLAALEERVQQLEDSRPGRKAQKLESTEVGVCGLEPGRDDVSCEDASVYRYQQGCRGQACVRANSEYYAEYRRRKKEESNGTPVAVG